MVLPDGIFQNERRIAGLNETRDEQFIGSIVFRQKSDVSQLFGKCPQDVRISSQVNKGKSTAFLGFLFLEEISSVFDR